MATKGKEKGGISPSYSRNTDPTHRRRSPHPPSSPDHQKHVSTTNPNPNPVPIASSDQKHIPNYLKPTISSSLDPSKHHYSPKKQTSTSTDNPTLTRRRSFDKPPSPQTTSPNSKEKNLRSSSSFKAKTASTLPKPNPERLPKASYNKDVGKPHTLHTRPVKSNVKKSITSSSKKQNNASTDASATRKAPISTTVDDTPKLELGQEDQESSLLTEEMENIEGSNNELPVEETLILEDKEHDVGLLQDDGQPEIDQSEDEVKKLCDQSSTVSEDQNASSPTVEMEELVKLEETPTEGPGSKDDQEVKDDNDHREEDSFASESKVDENEMKEGIGGEESGVDENPKLEALDLEEKEEVKDEGSHLGHGSDQCIEAEGAAKEVKAEEREKKSMVVKRQGSRKDFAAYNDVIEETASKLREQRKNKVKALVGAFETVISLEDPEAESSLPK